MCGCSLSASAMILPTLSGDNIHSIDSFVTKYPSFPHIPANRTTSLFTGATIFAGASTMRSEATWAAVPGIAVGAPGMLGQGGIGRGSVNAGCGKQVNRGVESYGEASVVYDGDGRKIRSPLGSIAGSDNDAHPMLFRHSAIMVPASKMMLRMRTMIKALKHTVFNF